MREPLAQVVDRRLRLLAHDSPDRQAVRNALGSMQSGGATSLRDATYAGLMLPILSHERPLLLVFTDGRDSELNRMNRQPAKLGYYANAQLQLNELGKVSISFDRGFLPGMSQTLLLNDMFRVIYLKTF